MSDPTKSSSLEERISQPEGTAKDPSWNSWSDEAASAAMEKNAAATPQLDGTADDDLSTSHPDPDKKVELKDIQGDVNSPLFSTATFEQLGM